MNLDEQFENQINQANSLEDLTQVLQQLFSGGYSLWSDGRLMYIKELVERVDGLRITINPREHAPPHFHVTGADVDALFSIEDCQLIIGTIGHRQEHLVRWWYKKSRSKLITIWNNTRSADCPVGPIQMK